MVHTCPEVRNGATPEIGATVPQPFVLWIYVWRRNYQQSRVPALTLCAGNCWRVSPSESNPFSRVIVINREWRFFPERNTHTAAAEYRGASLPRPQPAKARCGLMFEYPIFRFVFSPVLLSA